MKLETSHFGQIDIEEERVVRFTHGLPGFEELLSFAILGPEEIMPFAYLQSIEEPEISFLVTNPFAFYKDYEFELSETAQAELGVEKEEDLQIWSIVTMHEKLTNATMNLLAPIVINRSKQQGKQVILHNTSYTTKHALIQEKEAGDPAC